MAILDSRNIHIANKSNYRYQVASERVTFTYEPWTGTGNSGDALPLMRLPRGAQILSCAVDVQEAFDGPSSVTSTVLQVGAAGDTEPSTDAVRGNLFGGSSGASTDATADVQYNINTQHFAPPSNEDAADGHVIWARVTVGGSGDMNSGRAEVIVTYAATDHVDSDARVNLPR